VAVRAARWRPALAVLWTGIASSRGSTMALPDVPPFTKLLGVNVLHRSPERTEAELPVREDLCNRRGVLHGGAVMALGDTLGGLTASASLTPDGRTATIESKTNFFAAVPKGDTARAVCMPLHRGRTTIVLETRITRGDGKLAAIVTQTQLIFDKKE
jgi:1,4-dihydroxy-2-naphthoyl-CoA hydrolase